jgi:ATP:ADP antiporter, AAA family
MQLNIVRNIIKALEIEKQEVLPVFLLLSQSVFIGVFSGAFDIAGNSLFLEKFSSDILPKAFTISGVAGILMTALYSFFQNRIGFKTLASLNLVAISIATVLLWLGFRAHVGNWIYFAILVMMGPLIILSMLGFWGTAGRIFTLRQGKRLFGLIDAGQIVGIIAASYAIPVLLSFGVSTVNLLLLCTGAVIIALLFQVIIVFRKDIFTSDTRPPKEKTEMVGLIQLMKNRFVMLMAFFVALSMVCAFFVYYSFLAVTKMRYPDASEFAQFFGFFTGTVMVFTLLVKTLAYSKFMKTYGLRTSLVISPLVLMLLTVLACIVGAVGGYQLQAGGFLFFFLLIVLSRLLSRTLKDSIEAPSFKILYQSVDKKIRYNVQARVDGTVNEVSALFSGIALALLGMLSFINILHYSFTLIVLLATWAFVAFSLYREYKKNLANSLASAESRSNVPVMTATNIPKSLGSIPSDVYKLTQPLLYRQITKEFTGDNKLSDDFFRTMSQGEKLDISKKAASVNPEGNLSVLVHSRIPADRQIAAATLRKKPDIANISFLKVLLRDNHTLVRKEAIITASRYPDREIYSLLAENLLQGIYARESFESLYALGEPVVDALEQAFHKTGNESWHLVRIVRLLGLIGGENVTRYLFSKLHHHLSEVSEAAAQQLKLNKFRAEGEDYYNIQQVLTKAIGVAAWNIGMRQNLRDGNAGEALLLAMDEETADATDHVFLLLSLMYDSQSIDYVKATLESGGGESSGYALELLDLLLAEDIKPMIFPLFDDISSVEKIKLLQDHFPLEKEDYQESIIDLLNRDLNNLDLWTKICALMELKEMSQLTITDDIIALLFHPEAIICQLAASIIYDGDRSILEQIKERLPESARQSLKSYFDNKPGKPIDLPHAILIHFKKNNHFAKLKGGVLWNFIKKMERIVWIANTEIIPDDNLEFSWLWIAEGEVEITRNNNELIVAEAGSFVDLSNTTVKRLKSRSQATTYKLNYMDYQAVLFDNPEIAHYLVLEKQEN